MYGEGLRRRTAIDIERLNIGFAAETLRKHNLKNIASNNVLFSGQHHVFKFFAREIGFYFRRT